MMSIKSFHIFFVVICSVFFFLIGIYNLNNYLILKDSSLLMYSIGSMIGTIALLIYGNKFLKKIKNIDHA
ncbi:MAG: hypothetical protein CBD58_03055 [bacterium TMED198]|nr:MAG: hypothetical protein CBD58_03055 [bacterium TMED198]